MLYKKENMVKTILFVVVFFPFTSELQLKSNQVIYREISTSFPQT